MKITPEQNVKRVGEYQNNPDTRSITKTEKREVVKIDMTGMYTDDNAYKVHGRTKEDIMLEAGAKDVTAAQNYMTVMSNSLSGEDYRKMMEDGFDPSDMDGTQTVTILDHIKAVMADSGQIVAGYNDDLSAEELIDVVGSEAGVGALKRKMESHDVPATDDNIKQIEEAVSMMQEIDELTEGSIKYLVDNNLEPTIENIYLSRFSGYGDASKQARGYYAQEQSGYYAKKADIADWSELLPQVEKSVSSMNLEDITYDEAVDSAKWLLEKGLPVTGEKVAGLHNVKSIAFPVAQTAVIDAAVNALSEGKSAKQGNLTPGNKTIYEKAYEQNSRILSAIIGREESRLQLTIDANLSLMRRGITLDTTQLSDYVEQLKQEEENLKKQFFGESDITELNRKADEYNRTIDYVRDIPAMPVATIGRLSVIGEVTLSRVHSEGSALKHTYDVAGERYETMMTSPRKDLGDSIKKAFRNVDDILADIGLNTTEENRKAVRILGYNSMEINADAIRRIRELDDKVMGAVKSLTPGKTLELIKKGINPTELNLDELIEEIKKTDSNPDADAMKYSRFLYKLEQSNQITDEERESYIGIYRMLHQLEKTDYAAVGKVMNMGVPVTFANLLTAVRSSKKSVNVTIDDDFGLLENTVKKGTSITDQIAAAFDSRIGSEEAKRLEYDYSEGKARELRDVAANSEEAIYELLQNNSEVNISNVEASTEFYHNPNSLFRELKKSAKKADVRMEASGNSYEKDVDSAIEDFADKFNSREEATAAYEEMTERLTETLSDISVMSCDNMIDIKGISLMFKQLSLAGRFAKEENYYVPAEIGGEITNINLKLIHGKDKGTISVKMETEKYGTVRGNIGFKNEKVETVLIGNDKAGIVAMKEIGDRFEALLGNRGYDETKVSYAVANAPTGHKLSSENADINNEPVETAKLYDIAKQFIRAAQGRL